LAKIGRPELRKTVYYALGDGFPGELRVPVLLSRPTDQTFFEGWIMLAAAFFSDHDRLHDGAPQAPQGRY